jgi:hypothetical protein
MQQQLITLAAAGMFLLGVGIANAANENDIRSHDEMGTERSGCVAEQTPCFDRDMMTERTPLSQSDADVGLRLGQPDDSINEMEEVEADDADETAAEENEKPDILIIVQ